MIELDRIYNMDARAFLAQLETDSIDCFVTSPPYWGLRDYGVEGQIGLEKSVKEYVCALVEVFMLCHRALKPTGVFWLNIGDAYVGAGGDWPEEHRSKNYRSTKDNKSGLPMADRSARRDSLLDGGLKQKDLIGLPWRVAFALQDAGWYLRSDIIWHKENPMPESVQDRPTRAHEYIFMMTKSSHYYYDAEIIAEDRKSDDFNAPRGSQTYGQPEQSGRRTKGVKMNMTNKRNKRSVWTVNTAPFDGAHFATFPPKLIEPMILAGCPAGGVVCDPFMGSGTTALMARNLGRHYIGSELSPDYCAIARDRLAQPYTVPMFAEVVPEEKPTQTAFLD
jgi:DNA modification methylase